MNTTSELVGTFPPPPGVTPNFINPESTASQVVLCTILTLVFMIPFFVLRMYTKKYILKRIDPEDFPDTEAKYQDSIILAVLFALMYSIINLLQLKNGVGRHIWDVTLPQFKRFIITGIPSGISYTLSSLFVKVSLGQFYIRVSLDKFFKVVTYIIIFVWTLCQYERSFQNALCAQRCNRRGASDLTDLVDVEYASTILEESRDCVHSYDGFICLRREYHLDGYNALIGAAA
ncbi:uncharacterized protein SETTUDRAFT_30506 [Exserohilum turcica Et28A]|uniref:Rhodopsin domain-containing protein n=1 Tax=Exserohilum turcicum (strain 28A) TaxID=671987 RepID=R0KSS7_EXST2|nr:uncharacterized protein SETTUDRAFT_30506 [Exserohilum turcica Et28A]EOA92019.1 hypothetical protein SETTUDRAFT_30506 [Exserohilum turcica Et28A]